MRKCQIIKNIFLIITLFLVAFSISYAAPQDIDLKAELKLVNTPSTYYVYLSFNAISSSSLIKLWEDGKEKDIGPTQEYTDSKTKQKRLLASVIYPSPGDHSYRVAILNSAKEVLGQGTTSISVPGNSYQPSSSGAPNSTGQPVEIGAQFPGEPKNVDLIQHIYYVHKWATLIGSLLAVYMIVFAGFKYMTSAGNPEALQDAKDTIIGALVGLSIILLAYMLFQIVGIKVMPTQP